MAPFRRFHRQKPDAAMPLTHANYKTQRLGALVIDI
jgi:hypothetical protein